MEQFEGMSHEEIVLKVEVMKPGVMHEVASKYESIANALSGALLGAHLSLQRELSEGMGGQFADAAVQATKKFYDQANDVQEVLRAVGFRVDAAAYGAEVVRRSVPPLPAQTPGTNPAITTSIVDPAQIAQTVVGATDPAAAAALDRYKEEQRLVAVEAMNMAYKPTYQPAGDGVPTFVPVQVPGDGPGPSVPGGTSTAGPDGTTTTSATPGGETPGSETPGENQAEGEGTETAGTEEDSQTTTAGTNENPTTQQPSTTTGTPTGDPQRTTPSTTTTGSPSVSTGNPAGMPGGTPQPQTPGKTVTGTPGGPNTSTGSPSAASTAAGTSRGMSGMPGMMSSGAGKRGEEDDEHKTPDYLIQDREEELFGPRISALGGVLGADAPAAQPADDRGDRR
ncbi:hypothetical protein NLM24_10805 [Nocardia zapadnayensis]|uniref:hypothetical protein n=1 Tax=Nocardia rhamnosiphila TaxID=426716 RepID=UPI0022484AF4|nr:hypothetical protein [Nocardia zapadnayensis]MCX0271186.1 hypothetical protein [Nocardia zapadnayensis]